MEVTTVLNELSRSEQFDLAQRAASGDVDAFGEVYTRYASSVRWAIARLVSAEDIEDYVHDIFVHLSTRIGQYKGDAKISTWLFRVACNYVLMHRRETTKTKAERAMLSLDETFEHTSGKTSHASEPSYRHRLDLDSDVAAAIERLRPRRRAALQMYLDGYTGEEIAQSMHLSLPNIKSELHRAKADLKSMLKATSPDRSQTTIRPENLN